MKRFAQVAFGIAISAALSAASAQVPDGGGRDVSVLLFSTRTLRAVTVSPVSPGAPAGWTSRCATCAHHLLSQPVHLTSRSELFAGGNLRVTDDASGDSRAAAGLWHLRAGLGDSIDVVLTLPSERYVTAVLNAEAAPTDPPAALQALAIVARTYALNGTRTAGHFAASPGHLQAELCDSTECQALRLAPPSAAIQAAVQSTAGETLWFGARRAQVFFSQSCGGETESAGILWPALTGLPYLVSHPDAFCLRRSADDWHAEIAAADLVAIAHAQGWHLPEPLAAARVLRRSLAHRALAIEFTGASGRRALLSASVLRFAIGRTLGWNRIRSDWYDLGLRNGELVFDGRGHGHGAGLCQLGATEMAAEGKDPRAILAFYFPHTQVQITAADSGWDDISTANLHLRAAAGKRDPAQANRLQHAAGVAWDEARRRFPPKTAVTPSLTFAPTTEVFRQLSGEPGWALAGTRGQQIVLEPESVVTANRVKLEDLLLHELLHSLIEAEASARAPLWLREGLAEVLAGEPAREAPALTPSRLDTILAQPASAAESRAAHQAAAALVRRCVARFGASVVRSWLVAGPPSGMS